MIIGTVSKATLGKLLRDGVDRIIMSFPERTDTIELNWTGSSLGPVINDARAAAGLVHPPVTTNSEISEARISGDLSIDYFVSSGRGVK